MVEKILIRILTGGFFFEELNYSEENGYYLSVMHRTQGGASVCLEDESLLNGLTKIERHLKKLGYLKSENG